MQGMHKGRHKGAEQRKKVSVSTMLPKKKKKKKKKKKNNNNNLQAFQLIVLARYLLSVPNPSPLSQHALT